MALKYTITVWLIRQGVRLAWAMARTAERLGGSGERLEARMEAAAAACGVDMIDVLAPLSKPLSVV
jgi:hypothetical protein